MSVDTDTVKRVAHLARIAVTPEEAERMTGELNAILGFVEQLNEVDVTGVEPMTSVIPMEMKKRQDVVTDGNKADDIVALHARGLAYRDIRDYERALQDFDLAIKHKSDFILATAGEELGLAGLSAIFLLYGLLVERGYRAGLALRDPFGRLLAVGLASLVALQVFVIAGGVTGLIPLTGMAMPFLAQGGSSVVTNWAIVALLVRLSDSARRQGGGGAPR